MERVTFALLLLSVLSCWHVAADATNRTYVRSWVSVSDRWIPLLSTSNRNKYIYLTPNAVPQLTNTTACFSNPLTDELYLPLPVKFWSQKDLEQVQRQLQPNRTLLIPSVRAFRLVWSDGVGPRPWNRHILLRSNWMPWSPASYRSAPRQFTFHLVIRKQLVTVAQCNALISNWRTNPSALNSLFQVEFNLMLEEATAHDVSLSPIRVSDLRETDTFRRITNQAPADIYILHRRTIEKWAEETVTQWAKTHSNKATTDELTVAYVKLRDYLCRVTAENDSRTSKDYLRSYQEDAVDAAACRVASWRLERKWLDYESQVDEIIAAVRLRVKYDYVAVVPLTES